MATPLTGPHAQPVSVFDLPGKSARIVQKYWKLFAFANLPAIVLSLMATLDNNESNNKSLENINSSEIAALIGFGLIAAIAIVLISLFFYVMVIRLSLDAVNNKKVTANELINVAAKYWVRLLGLALLMALIIGVGLILLIIPGIIAAVLLMFAPIILIDKNLSIVDSLKSSYELVSSNLGAVLSALLVVIGIAIAASIVKEVPIVGPLLGTAISIAFSLILFLRYEEIKNTVKPQVKA